MDTTTNRETLQQVMTEYYEAFNAKDRQRVLGVFSENCEFVDLTMGRNMKGHEQLSAFMTETWRLSPFFKIEPIETLFDGGRAAVRLTMSGAPKIDADGTPKAGHLWSIPSTSFFRFEAGKICWKADCWNMLAIPKQVGWLKMLPNLIRANRKPK
ncbi:MAG: nuclear transport factor 2 family protein [Pseudomonadota bacterium]